MKDWRFVIAMGVYLITAGWYGLAIQGTATTAHAKADDDRRYQIANCTFARKLAAIVLTDARARITFESKPGLDAVTHEQAKQWKATEKQLADLEAPICPPQTSAVPTSRIKPLATPSPVSHVRIERASRPLVARTGD